MRDGRRSNNKLSAFPYPGGKTVYCQEIIKRFPTHRRYVEPFGGSAAVLLNKPRSYIEVFNDLDDDIVQFFEALRNRREDLVEWLDRVPYSRSLYNEWSESYYAGDRPEDPVERAGRWFYLRYTQFNGAVVKRKGFKTGGKRNEARSFRGSIEDLDAIADRFAEVTIECQSYETVIDRYDHPDSLFYIDPPYYDATRPRYRYGDDFDHSRLATVLTGTDADWIVSYDEVPPALSDIEETVETYTARYSMSYSEERPEHTERLVLNFNPDDRTSFSVHQQANLEGFK